MQPKKLAQCCCHPFPAKARPSPHLHAPLQRARHGGLRLSGLRRAQVGIQHVVAAGVHGGAPLLGGGLRLGGAQAVQRGDVRGGRGRRQVERQDGLRATSRMRIVCDCR